jgi:hypothetical protein
MMGKAVRRFTKSAVYAASLQSRVLFRIATFEVWRKSRDDF